jgi:hypothetical protein
MDAVWLPVLKRTVDLHQVLTAMDEAKRSAVMVEDAEGCDLVYIGSVLEALDQGVQTLSNLGGLEAVHVADIPDANAYQVDLIRPLRTPLEYERLLETVVGPYAMVALAHERGLLVTLHEGAARDASQWNTWYCNGPVTHYFPKPTVQVGDNCPKCEGSIFLR